MGDQWWPDGIDLGTVPTKELPKVLPDVPSLPWAYEGNHFDWSPPDLPFSDFPGLSLNVPILSERAAGALSALGTVSVAAALTVDGQRFFAVQPQRAPATQAGLAGLEHIELVFDEEGPIVPSYPSAPRAEVHTFWKRGKMEAEMICWRSWMWAYSMKDIDEACLDLFSTGRLSFADRLPTYSRNRS